MLDQDSQGQSAVPPPLIWRFRPTTPCPEGVPETISVSACWTCYCKKLKCEIIDTKLALSSAVPNAQPRLASSATEAPCSATEATGQSQAADSEVVEGPAEAVSMSSEQESTPPQEESVYAAHRASEDQQPVEAHAEQSEFRPSPSPDKAHQADSTTDPLFPPRKRHISHEPPPSAQERRSALSAPPPKLDPSFMADIRSRLGAAKSAAPIVRAPNAGDSVAQLRSAMLRRPDNGHIGHVPVLDAASSSSSLSIAFAPPTQSAAEASSLSSLAVSAEPGPNANRLIVAGKRSLTLEDVCSAIAKIPDQFSESARAHAATVESHRLGLQQSIEELLRLSAQDAESRKADRKALLECQKKLEVADSHAQAYRHERSRYKAEQVKLEEEKAALHRQLGQLQVEVQQLQTLKAALDCEQDKAIARENVLKNELSDLREEIEKVRSAGFETLEVYDEMTAAFEEEKKRSTALLALLQGIRSEQVR